MKVFTVLDQKRIPIKYEFICHDGLLMSLASCGEYGNERPFHRSYRKPFPGQPLLSESVFISAFKAMLTDESFSDFTAFFKAIEDDELYLPIAKNMLANHISSLAERIHHISLALTYLM